MKNVFATAMLALGLTSCATQSTTSQHAPVAGPGSQSIELPGQPGPGPSRDVRVLLDNPALKLATITLRGGTVLPEHQAAVPVTIQALIGGGTLVTQTGRLRLDITHAVMLDAKVPHSVEPDAGTDLVLLIHHLGHSGEPTP